MLLVLGTVDSVDHYVAQHQPGSQLVQQVLIAGDIAQHVFIVELRTWLICIWLPLRLLVCRCTACASFYIRLCAAQAGILMILVVYGIGVQ